ncbi:MerR family transcriptional regulator [Burkholderia multivorans]|uniref:MerR family transcriptional regulator n=1 Tax=Burkholderia multivorans TaxID=87883 RepID=UPI000D00FDC6|nr:MerR family transcriptional regulator [Burkholderia multivorans]MBR8242450.1 MerR family transcriptional regulator [Burkholderia multivorans]MDN7942801.1 MerR family transcriptional regulator [Burkholderia multivorans]MDR9173606.1 Nodulation protein NolA [Burkholderia multivorans]MDR9181508.1 Nodulation protein NolA [Burkholderia multivorans]MDR9186948.1 Nodulation protein NolA [Burkholderia multivorans]
MKNTPSQQLLAIGQLSQLTGASVRSIRHYDEHGLLTSVRASNGYRMFPEKAVTQVKQIQRMIATGFTIDDIRGFPDCMLLIEGARSCDQITEVQRARLEAIERQIADLEKRRARLLKTLNEGVIPPVD